MSDGIDVIAKLYRLNGKLDDLTKEDRTFVSETVRLHEEGNGLKLDQVLRIVDVPVPGEEPTPKPIWTQGTVSVVYASPEERIWRYMPLEQLLALLWGKSLHFSPLSSMPDATEGQLPPEAFEETKKQLPQNILDGRCGIDADTVTAIMVEQRRTDACINCWYTHPTEGLEMWRQYAPRNGVAIQTTIRRLASCFSDCQTPIRIIPVTYYSPDEQVRYTFEAFCGSLFIKHGCYRHERELRALASRANTGCGVDLPVDVGMLIERLVLSPELKDWAVPVITEAIRRFDFNGVVEKSRLTVDQQGDTENTATESLPPPVQQPEPPSSLPPHS